MTTIDNGIIFLIGDLCFLLILLAFWIGNKRGFKNGVEQALLQTDFVNPSIEEITIRGQYQIDNESTEQIIHKLNEWMIRRAFRYNAFENVLKLVNVSEPAESRKEKNYFEKLKNFRSGYPYEINFYMSPSSDPRILNVDVIALPYMHRQMAQGVLQSFPKSHVEDAQRMCKDMIKEIMCILNAKIIEEPFIEASLTKVKKTELYTNNIEKNDVNNKVHELISKSKHHINLVGWIDREFIGDLENALTKGVQIKIVTKNPRGSDKLVKLDFERLIKKIPRNNIRLNSRVHDRFLIADSESIIGSFYFQSASKTRFESVIKTNDEQIITKLNQHFNKIWNDVNSTKPKS